MNIRTPRFLTSTALAVAALSLSSVAAGQTGASMDQKMSSHLRLVSKKDLKWSADKLTGTKLTTRDGTKLGSIKDFLIEADSGRIRFAVVSTGGFAGVGNKLHVVPYYMLSRNGDDSAFTVSITQDTLSRAPTISEEMFEEDRVAVDSHQQQQIDHAFSTSGMNVTSSLPTPGLLFRATKLDGRDVEASGVTIGSLEGVVIERGATHAFAVFRPEHGRIGGDQKFLVPISRLNIEVSKAAVIPTTLTQSDFQAAEQANASAHAEQTNSRHTLSTQQSSNVAGDATSGTAAVAKSSSHAGEKNPAPPTGESSVEQNLGATPSIVSASHAIRQALDADSALATADVRVTPKQGRVLIQGTVKSEKQKAAIERAADNAAGGTNIDFDLTVRDQ